MNNDERMDHLGKCLCTLRLDNEGDFVVEIRVWRSDKVRWYEAIKSTTTTLLDDWQRIGSFESTDFQKVLDWAIDSMKKEE